MNYRRAFMTSMMSARTHVMSMSALIAVLQCWHLKTRQFQRVPFGAVAVADSMPRASGRAQFGLGQFAMSVSIFGCGREILA
ncbi:hypothetical protein DF107_17970 [Burkholderia stagnalis]|uniref:hypothetical protein n=1 Tax=Burkholderia stagnalis TaxID=1503054 RepID=UPI000F5B3D05|nr:hypothetical protein [Burkholderia stagnalis]RQQ19692.1 hypothetical protein DF161_06900 [Burkholderia stagnalis]RQY80005.1 hypothetical protein DF107_17970 [Burkholderia stagnalis]